MATDEAPNNNFRAPSPMEVDENMFVSDKEKSNENESVSNLEKSHNNDETGEKSDNGEIIIVSNSTTQSSAHNVSTETATTAPSSMTMPPSNKIEEEEVSVSCSSLNQDSSSDEEGENDDFDSDDGTGTVMIGDILEDVLDEDDVKDHDREEQVHEQDHKGDDAGMVTEIDSMNNDCKMEQSGESTHDQDPKAAADASQSLSPLIHTILGSNNDGSPDFQFNPGDIEATTSQSNKHPDTSTARTTSPSIPRPRMKRQKSKSDVSVKFAQNANIPVNPMSSNMTNNNNNSSNIMETPILRHTLFDHSNIPPNISNHPNSTPILPPQQLLRHRQASRLKPQPLHLGIPQSLAISMTRQHAQFAHACVDLLDQRDWNETIRRRNIHRALLSRRSGGSGSKSNNKGMTQFQLMSSVNTALENSRGNDDAVLHSLDESCLLMTLIKTGPLYKLHRKGGSATKRLHGSKAASMSGSIMRDSGLDTIASDISGLSSMSKMSATVVRTGVTSKLLTKWKTKYVEVRKGVLSYYDDAPSSGLTRKNIPLLSSMCACRPINDDGDDNMSVSILEQLAQSSKPSDLYAFEVDVEGDVPRIWATGSEANRRAWIDAIGKGMINDCRDVDPSNDPYKSAVRGAENEGDANTLGPEHYHRMRRYSDLSHAAKFATSSETYIDTFAKKIWGSTHCIPVKLLLRTVAPLLDDSEFDKGVQTQRPLQPMRSHEQFWHDLRHSIIILNGQNLQGDSIYGAERVFGALTRSIMECDKLTQSALEEGAVSQRMSGVGREASKTPHAITEMQAVRCARDVLRSVGRARDWADQLRLAVESLCENGADLVAVEGVDEELGSRKAPLVKINTSSHLGKLEGDSKKYHRARVHTDRREWIHVRNARNPSVIEQLFCILSVGVVSFYQQFAHKPCLLQGQMFLVGARLGVWEQQEGESNGPKYALCIVGQEDGVWTERQLCFEDYELFLQWKNALILAIQSCSPSTPHVLYHSDQFSLDEIDISRPSLLSMSSPSSPRSPAAQTPTPLHLLEKDDDGVSWIVQHPPGTNGDRMEWRVSLGLATYATARKGTPLSESNGYVDAKSVPSAKKSKMPTLFRNKTDTIYRMSEKKSLKRTSRNSIGNDSLVDDIVQNIDEDTTTANREPSVEVGLHMSAMYRVYFKRGTAEKDDSPNGGTIMTIRATFNSRLLLVGGKNAEVMKEPELIKLDGLKGSVGEGAFDFIFDTKNTPQRRATIG